MSSDMFCNQKIITRHRRLFEESKFSKTEPVRLGEPPRTGALRQKTNLSALSNGRYSVPVCGMESSNSLNIQNSPTEYFRWKKEKAEPNKKMRNKIFILQKKRNILPTKMRNNKKSSDKVQNKNMKIFSTRF
eukprot:GEMP01122061.1.p1 GENE.GEMP01122061.1~~GEMP01122061.1.p1  ORF type:complete len:139 (-),score=4.82 GEMP01122061.1:177-572(-)